MLSKEEWKNYFQDLKKGKKQETEGGRFILGSFTSASPQQTGSGVGIAQGVLPPVSRSSGAEPNKIAKKRKRRRVLKKITLKKGKGKRGKTKRKTSKKRKSKTKARRKKTRKNKAKRKPQKKKGKKRKIKKKKGDKRKGNKNRNKLF